ncbi:MAG: SDR family NAD(P)-dependent oxidoreductase [Thermoanaerobaculia bacterium]
MISVDLEGRVALVTGASRGIGAAVAEMLATANARVALHYGRSREAAEAVAGRITASGAPTPLLVGADLESETGRRECFGEVASRLGPPLLLVNNAAIFERNPFDETDDALFLRKWHRTLSINLDAAAHLSLLTLPAMRAARFGRIVMISSRSAFRGETDCADYAVSKAGMVSLARCLARAEGKHGITANSVCPGWVETEMAAADLAVRRAQIEAEIPLGRVATPEEIAGAVLWYLSPLGAYANGTALPLNGGSFLH